MLTITRRPFFAGLFIVFFLLSSCETDPAGSSVDWAWYQGDPGTRQYSPLDQITPENVAQLEVAWTLHTGDLDTLNRSQIQCNPLVIDGVVYGTSPKLKALAIDAATGEELWRFDPFASEFDLFGMGNNRGLSYWTDGDERRVFYAAGHLLYSLDAATGRPDPDFGDRGMIDLHDGLGRDVSDFFVVATSPGVVFEDKIIMGTRVSEALGAAPGHIRAYNVRTGAQEWIFHTIPAPGDFGADTWPAGAHGQIGGANAWAGMSLDPERGWVFVPTGSASYDFYGGDRPGDNLFANCVLALDARTGERIWHYQTVRHDLWDRDLPAPPVLVRVLHEGVQRDAVAQITKSGYVFVLDRETGEPLFPVEEVPVPASDLEGEYTAATQPIPTAPPPFARQRVTRDDLYSLDSAGHAEALAVYERSREGEPFIPPSEEGTILFPGFDGGGEWGGAAFDPQSGQLYVNSSEMPWILKMNPYVSDGSDGLSRGERIYRTNCVSCHASDFSGGGVFQAPSLVGVHNRLELGEVVEIIENGRGTMAGFAFLGEEEVAAVSAFILDPDNAVPEKEASGEGSWPYPYVMAGYERFQVLDDRYPGIDPPWGQLTAVDLNTGTLAWQVPLGEHPDLVARGIRNSGTENYGGPVVTAGNLIFIAATLDEKIRAFDQRTGEQLWEHDLPAAGYATPAVYAVNGKQYVLIACGGGKIGTKSGDAYVAFALP
jgi:quinoprotein glucose dehydrogenase